MDRTLSADPASLAIQLTDDPTNRLTPDRTERQWDGSRPAQMREFQSGTSGSGCKTSEKALETQRPAALKSGA